jgi:hypothetical protein
MMELKHPAEYGIPGSPRKIVLHGNDTASRLKKMSYGTTGAAAAVSVECAKLIRKIQGKRKA